MKNSQKVKLPLFIDTTNEEYQSNLKNKIYQPIIFNVINL